MHRRSRGDAGLIEKAGAYYSLGKACEYLGEHPELAAALRTDLVALRKAESASLAHSLPVGR
jgi:hypothetical protein